MDIEATPYSFLVKWKDLVENGGAPVDIEIEGIGTFTNAKLVRNGNDDVLSYTLMYDKCISEGE